MTDIQKTREQLKEIFSDKTCRELSALLERSWQSIRNGQSDLRPIESQIKGIFKKEVERHTNQALTALLEAMPEKKPSNRGHMDNMLDDGFNQALSQFTAIIEGQLKKGKV